MSADSSVGTDLHSSLSSSESIESVHSDNSEVLEAIELDLDPNGLVTLTLEEELVEKRRVAEICERYELTVLVPQALAAKSERDELVRLSLIHISEPTRPY